ncbi:MAG: TAXI family TRAP transporter solute-binding subunit [Nitrospinae bacterium]|nr:TAXI family TRAP transporter solute-binding subunit [Nitrospinota bacterium]
MRKTTLRLITLAAGLALVISAAPAADAAKILLGTSQPGGATFEIGTAMGKVITDNSGGKISVDAAVTGGSTANVRILQKKNKMQPFRMGMATAPAVAWGQTGRKPFKKPQDVLALGALYPLTVVYTTFKTTGIKKWSDLTGKRFVVGGRGGSIYIVTQLALKHSGIKAKREFFNNNQNSAAIKDQRVDAGFFFLNGGVPAPVYMDLARTLSGKLHFFGPDEATIKKLAVNEAGIVRDIVGAGSIPGYNKDIISWGQMWSLMTNSKMSNDNAYAIVKALYDNHKQITKYHPAGKFITKKTGLRGLKKLKMHPGAARYWKEAGM